MSTEHPTLTQSVRYVTAYTSHHPRKRFHGIGLHSCQKNPTYTSRHPAQTSRVAWTIALAERLMVTYSLHESSPGRWTVTRAGRRVFGPLKLQPATHLAREAARDEHARSGSGTCVEIIATEIASRIAHYPPLSMRTAPAPQSGPETHRHSMR